MTKAKKIVIGLVVILILLASGGYWYLSTMHLREFTRVAYIDHCASCHGQDFVGTTNGPGLLTGVFKYGEDYESLMRSIKDLEAHQNIGWPDDFPDTGIKALALYISERRQQYPSTTASYQFIFQPQVVDSQHHRFKVELFSSLKSQPYSIAPMTDGRILVSEKVRGLSIVDTDGTQGDLISGIPAIYDKFFDRSGAFVGWGYSLEVALHPDYEKNGWIYLSHGDRCQLGCGSAIPQSMVRVVRGRINNNQWHDEQTIWSVDTDYYTVVPDTVSGARLDFDKEGHIYVTVGGKSFYKNLHIMDTPYGKIHRVKDDGTIPQDNPFWVPKDQQEESSTRNTVWSYGHRTTQGLATHPVTGEIWASEMGPRGGDEINKIIKQGNYGWPLYTNGLDYDSSEITIGKDLGLDFPIEDTVLPVVDFTPAPALSNFTFHQGQKFPDWQNDILIGSLKAMTIYRLRIENDVLVEKETLATNVGRIRDIEMGADGLVYVAIEHGETGSIIRLIPTD